MNEILKFIQELVLVIVLFIIVSATFKFEFKIRVGKKDIIISNRLNGKK